MHKNKLYLSIAATVLACTALVGLFVFNADAMNRSAEVLKHDNTELLTSEKGYTDKVSHVHAAFKKNAVRSSDPVIRSTAINQRDNEMITEPFTRFFKVMWDYDNHTDYIERPDELHGVATPNVYGNKRVFDDDKDTTGDSIVDAEQLHSRFSNLDLYVTGDKGCQLSVTADVLFNGWTTGNQQNTGENVYEMTFNKKSRKITSMKKILHISNTQNS